LLQEVSVKLVLSICIAAAAAAGVVLPDWQARTGGPPVVILPAGPFASRATGDFRRDGRSVDAPLMTDTAPAPLAIMARQVSRRDYAACVADGDCVAAVTTGADDMPQTGVSWQDATAYAVWLSGETGMDWRLPSDAEWQRAAAERAANTAVASSDDPAQRWLAQYAATTRQRGPADPVLRQGGAFGANSQGVEDIAGNVWEWTDSCMISATATGTGPFSLADPYCGVRIAQGRHPAAVIDFVRDAQTGGCGMGLPPDHLGFRLVRDHG
jgi:formylglycine-generating enzyme required for sulfatase activity